MPKLKDKLKKTRTFRKLVINVKRFSFPGFEGVPIYNVLSFFFNEIKRDVFHIRAKAIAFSFFLAIFPALLFIFTLIPYIPVPSLQDNLIEILSGFIPLETFDMLEATITEIVAKQRGDLLSLGFIVAIFFATTGMVAMMDSFDKTNATFVKRGFLKSRWIAFKLTLILVVLFILTIVLVIAGNKILAFLIEFYHFKSSFTYFLFTALKWLIVILMFFIGISMIYYYGPAVRKKWRFISAGSTLATFLSILISLGFSYYVNNFGHYNILYGSIGTIIVFMLWLYLNSLTLLIGFELNASIAYNKLKLSENNGNGHSG